MSDYGYARVSTAEQNLDRQLMELRKYVPEDNIVIDRQSGRDLNRPGYQALKGVLGLRRGDTLYIKSLDRPRCVKPDNWEGVVSEWRAGRITAKSAYEMLNLSKSTFYRMIRQE